MLGSGPAALPAPTWHPQDRDLQLLKPEHSAHRQTGNLHLQLETVCHIYISLKTNGHMTAQYFLQGFRVNMPSGFIVTLYLSHLTGKTE